MRARWMYSPMGTYLSFFNCGTGDQIGPETAVIIPPRGEDALTRLKRPPPHREHTSFRGRVTAHDLGIFYLGWCIFFIRRYPSLPKSFHIYSAIFSAPSSITYCTVYTAATLEPEWPRTKLLRSADTGRTIGAKIFPLIPTRITSRVGAEPCP